MTRRRASLRAGVRRGARRRSRSPGCTETPSVVRSAGPAAAPSTAVPDDATSAPNPDLTAEKKAAGIADCPTTDAAPAKGGLPDVRVECLGGGAEVRLSALRGPTLVNVWASWCGPCRSEAPFLAQAGRAGSAVSVLGVDLADTAPGRRGGVRARGGLDLPPALRRRPRASARGCRSPRCPSPSSSAPTARVAGRHAGPFTSAQQLADETPAVPRGRAVSAAPVAAPGLGRPARHRPARARRAVGRRRCARRRAPGSRRSSRSSARARGRPGGAARRAGADAALAPGPDRLPRRRGRPRATSTSPTPRCARRTRSAASCATASRCSARSRGPRRRERLRRHRGRRAGGGCRCAVDAGRPAARSPRCCACRSPTSSTRPTG